MPWSRRSRTALSSSFGSNAFGSIDNGRRLELLLIAFVELVSLPSWLFGDDLEKRVHLKVFRDDQHQFIGDEPACFIRGNKARKLAFYAQYLDSVVLLPKEVFSHGGVQSNAMLALARLCASRELPFSYITRPIPRWLRKTPCGNLEHALALGMQLRECDSTAVYEAEVRSMQQQALEKPADILFIPQGVACPEAALGLRQLAETIVSLKQVEFHAVCLPAGTGTTAWFLRQYLPPEIDVLTAPCVGDVGYLQAQMQALQASCQRTMVGETHVSMPSIKMLHRKHGAFGTPRLEYYWLWQALPPYFDLIYAPPTIIALAELFVDNPEQLDGVLYLATGGAEGNLSQIRRYQRIFGASLEAQIAGDGELAGSPSRTTRKKAS
jgi:1-aminocyclopropane-1-carboxylate deaminase/D-cysteine desulfhydrase-like pyridoxal-dependent ACC family enzyme